MFSFSVHIDTPALLRKFVEREEKAQAFLDNEVIRTSYPFVPFLQGMLADTVMDEEPGTIVYVQPYARRQYYGDAFQFSKQHHPLAGSRWTERAKTAYIKDWTKGVENILKGRNL